jgi:uncharacterized membrane protein
MSLDQATLVAILAMAVITYLTRIAGIFVAGRLALRGRAKAAFDAIPPAVLVAVIAPMALATGWRETVAALVTAIAATRLPLLATIATGVLAVVALRALTCGRSIEETIVGRSSDMRGADQTGRARASIARLRSGTSLASVGQ